MNSKVVAGMLALALLVTGCAPLLAPRLWDATQQAQEAYQRMQEAETFSDAWAVHAADYAATLHELILLTDPLNPEVGAFMARVLEILQSMMDVGEVYRQIKAAQQRGDYVEALRHSVIALNEMTMLTEKVRRLDEAGHSLGQEYQPALDEMRRLLSDMPHPTFFQSELAEGQYLLGQLYHRGDEVQDVQKDLVEAAVWYRQAAERGHIEAQLALGTMHADGTGALEDPVEALAWLEVSAAQGHEEARKLKRLIAKRLTDQGIQRARERARMYWEAYVVPFKGGFTDMKRGISP